MEELDLNATETQAEQHVPHSNNHRWLRRYMSLASILVCAYLVYLFFFSTHSVMRRIEYQQVIDSLNYELTATRDSVTCYQNLNRQLNSDPEAIEQVVRERHNMNRPDEDVYLMTPAQ